MKNFIKRTIDSIRRKPLLVKPVIMCCLSEEQYDFLKNAMGFKRETIDDVLNNKDNEYFDDFSKNITKLIELHKSILCKIVK
jgi:6-phosphogluconate dehydrogenase